MKKKLTAIITFLFVSIFFGGLSAYAEVTLYTPYTGLTASPGETIDYSIDLINPESGVRTVRFDIPDLPDGWTYTITSGGKVIKELSVRGNGEQVMNLEVTVPLEIEQADYRFRLVATDQTGATSELPFLVSLSEKGIFETEFNVEQANLQGHTDSSFSYSGTIRNRTAEKQTYALTAKAPDGWAVRFQSGGDNVSSVTVEPNSETEVTIDVTPPEAANADTYKIEASANGSGTNAKVELEAVITGSYDLVLTTPRGNLSTDLVAGREKTIDLVVENTGTASVTDVKLSASAPPNWETEFEPSSIPEIAAGESVTVKAKMKAADDAIAGDYVTSFTANAQETSADADFRISVETSTLWGLVGVAIIIAVVAVFYFVIKKYGRR